MSKLTETELKEALHYSPDTGIFTRRKDGGGAKVGDIAGCTNNVNGYIQIGVKGKLYLAHRLAWLYMTGEWPKDQIDHINRVRNDNRWENIRDVSRAGNRRNQKLDKRNTSGTCGVYWHKTERKWHAIIGVNGEPKHLGSFECKDDAISTRKAAEKEYGYHENHGINLD